MGKDAISGDFSRKLINFGTQMKSLSYINISGTFCQVLELSPVNYSALKYRASSQR